MSYGSEKENQAKIWLRRWERTYPIDQVRFLVEDKLKSVRSKYQRPLLETWLTEHPSIMESTHRQAEQPE